MASSEPGLNPTENLWAIVKKIYNGGRQYNSKSEVWDAIQKSCKGISPNEIESITNSMDKRLILIIQEKGSYINM